MLETVNQTCPYCAQRIELVIDCSVEDQTYIEDCQVCCQPIVVSAVINQQGIPELELKSENE